MILGIKAEDVETFYCLMDELRLELGKDLIGPYVYDFDHVHYSFGNLNVETLTQIKIVFPTMKVINHA